MIDPDVIYFMEEVSREAGSILMSGFRKKDLEINFKGKRDLVTEKDLESEKFITEQIINRYPEHTVVAEEGNNYQGNDSLRWYIDPLDGTNNYAHGIPIFAVNLALFDEKQYQVVAACTFDPNRNEMYTASKGQGAFCNNEKIHVSTTGNLGNALLVTGYPYEKDDPASNNTRETSAFMPHIRCLRRFGSAALDLCNVAAGYLDGYWEMGLKPWDMAAGLLIVAEAGGKVTAYNGTAATVHSSAICASNTLLHQQMTDVLQGCHDFLR